MFAEIPDLEILHVQPWYFWDVELLKQQKQKQQLAFKVCVWPDNM